MTKKEQLEKLWPGHTDEWYDEVAERLRRYVALAVEIVRDTNR
jgi:hypothetical protein